ncbi:MAG: hypothetical protein ACTHJ6_09815 [Oryzihumus sp.]
MTVIDPLLEPRRARTVAIRALLNYALPLIGLPIILLLPFPAAAVIVLILGIALDRGGRPVEVWDANERPEKSERRRGIRSAAFLRFWAEQAGWPVQRALRIRRLLRLASVVVYLIAAVWIVYSMTTTGS